MEKYDQTIKILAHEKHQRLMQDLERRYNDYDYYERLVLRRVAVVLEEESRMNLKEIYKDRTRAVRKDVAIIKAQWAAYKAEVKAVVLPNIGAAPWWKKPHHTMGFVSKFVRTCHKATYLFVSAVLLAGAVAAIAALV